MYTAEHIASELQKITDHWGITRKIAAIVTDNAPNMVAAIRTTGWTYIHCFAILSSKKLSGLTQVQHGTRKSMKI